MGTRYTVAVLNTPMNEGIEGASMMLSHTRNAYQRAIKATFLAGFGKTFFPTRNHCSRHVSESTMLFDVEERRAQVSNKAGTKNDKAKIEEHKLMDWIIAEHENTLKSRGL